MTLRSPVEAFFQRQLLGVSLACRHARTISGWIKSLITAETGVRFDRAHFRSFDDSALTFEVVYFMLDADYNHYMDIRQRILLGVARQFEKEGVEFAYPSRTVFLKSDRAAAVPEAAGR